MTYQFPPDVAKLVQAQMASGGYNSEDDLLRDALSALQAVGSHRVASHAEPIRSLDELRQKVQVGLDQLDRGEGRDAEEMFERLLSDLPSTDESTS